MVSAILLWIVICLNIKVMNLNNFTIKAQESIAQAQQLAYNNGNPAITYSKGIAQ